MKKYVVTLTAGEREHLAGMVAAGKAAAQKLAHARILLEADAAYERGGTVWFRGADVAARAGLAEPAALALAREFGEDLDDVRKPGGRDHWADVAVWRAAGPGMTTGSCGRGSPRRSGG